MKDNVFQQKLMKIVLPITIQNFLVALVPVADAIMLVSLDQDAMSAVSLAAQVAFVLQLFTLTITSGASMFAAQFWGKRDIRSIEDLYGFCILLSIPVTLLFFLANFLTPGLVMRIFTSEPAIIAYGAQYLRVVSFYYIFNSFMLVTETIMKNTDIVKPVTVISSVMVVLNIVLNAVFIFGLFGAPKMEAAGAALATTISGIVGFCSAVVVQWKKGQVHFRVRALLRVPKELSSKYVKYTMPIFGNQIFWGIGFTMITVIMGHLGSDAIAANSVVVVVKDLISCFCFALATGGSILVGNELGAGNLEKGKEYGGRICKLALYSGLAAGVLIAATSPLIVSMVNLTETSAGYLQVMLLMCVYYMVGRSMNSTVISGIFWAGGDTRFGFICDMITMWCFIVPVGALAAFVLKLPVLVVFFLLNLDEMVKLPAVYMHYKKYLWVKDLTQNEQ